MPIFTQSTAIAITTFATFSAVVFGSSADSVQAAYNGFAKGQFQLLDNLKLGYGGTKEEMERLLDDANKLNAAQGKWMKLPPK